MTISDLAPEEWGLLANTIQQPAKQLVLALVESDVQSILLTDRIKQKTKTVFTLDWNTSISAPELLEKATKTLPGFISDMDEPPVLCIRESHLVHSNDSQNVDRFWAHANQLREAWAALPACCIFIVGPGAWDAITRSAPDLRSWFVIKLDFRWKGSPLENLTNCRFDLHGGNDISTKIAENRIERIERTLASVDHELISEETVAHHYRLPLFQALLSLGYLKRAAKQYEILRDADLPKSAHFAWFRLATGFALNVRRFSEAKIWLDIRLAKAGQNGAERSEIFHQLGFLAQQQGDYEVAKKWYERSLEIDQKKLDQRASSITYHQLGIMAQENREWLAAKRWYLKSLEIEKKTGHSVGLAGCYFQLGRLYEEQRKFTEAKIQYEACLEIFENLRHRRGTALALHQLGTIADETTDYPNAEALYKRSLEIFERLGNEYEISGVLHQLGNLAKDTERYSEADNYYHRSLEISRRLGNEKRTADTLHQLGVLAMDTGDYNLAVESYEQALRISRRLNEKSGMAATLHQLGLLLLAREHLTESVPHLIESATLFNQANDPHQFSIVEKTLSQAFQRATPELRKEITTQWIDSDLPEQVIRAWGKKVVSPAETTEG